MAGGESTLTRSNLLLCNLDSKLHVILLFEVLISLVFNPERS